MANKLLWICLGTGIFILIAFIFPTPQTLVEIVQKYGFAEKMMEWEVVHNIPDAAHKTMIVLGIIPMAIIFFATEAIPIGLTGILMPVLAYFLHLLPRSMIGKTFAGDAPMFLLGVLAMGVAVVDVGLHKRLATWLLGWTKGFLVPIFVLCISMSDAGTTALLGPIVIPMGIMSGVEGEPWAVGLAVAFASSFAHFLIVGTPNNAIVYGLGTYPDTGKR